MEVVAMLGVEATRHAEDPWMDPKRSVLTEEASESVRNVRQRPLRIVIAGDDMDGKTRSSGDA
jgi:hypothetical protein